MADLKGIDNASRKRTRGGDVEDVADNQKHITVVPSASSLTASTPSTAEVASTTSTTSVASASSTPSTTPAASNTSTTSVASASTIAALSNDSAIHLVENSAKRRKTEPQKNEPQKSESKPNESKANNSISSSIADVQAQPPSLTQTHRRDWTEKFAAVDGHHLLKVHSMNRFNTRYIPIYDFRSVKTGAVIPNRRISISFDIRLDPNPMSRNGTTRYAFQQFFLNCLPKYRSFTFRVKSSMLPEMELDPYSTLVYRVADFITPSTKNEGDSENEDPFAALPSDENGSGYCDDCTDKQKVHEFVYLLPIKNSQPILGGGTSASAQQQIAPVDKLVTFLVCVIPTIRDWIRFITHRYAAFDRFVNRLTLVIDVDSLFAARHKSNEECGVLQQVQTTLSSTAKHLVTNNATNTINAINVFVNGSRNENGWKGRDSLEIKSFFAELKRCKWALYYCSATKTRPEIKALLQSNDINVDSSDLVSFKWRSNIAALTGDQPKSLQMVNLYVHQKQLRKLCVVVDSHANDWFDGNGTIRIVDPRSHASLQNLATKLCNLHIKIEQQLEKLFNVSPLISQLEAFQKKATLLKSANATTTKTTTTTTSTALTATLTSSSSATASSLATASMVTQLTHSVASSTTSTVSTSTTTANHPINPLVVETNPKTLTPTLTILRTRILMSALPKLDVQFSFE